MTQNVKSGSRNNSGVLANHDAPFGTIDRCDSQDSIEASSKVRLQTSGFRERARPTTQFYAGRRQTRKNLLALGYAQKVQNITVSTFK